MIYSSFPLQKSLSLLLLVVILGVPKLISANDYHDSLLTITDSTQNDSLKVATLNDLGWDLVFVNPDSTLALAEKARMIAHANGYAKLELQSISHGGIALAVMAQNARALYWMNEGIDLAFAQNDSAALAKFLNGMGNIYGDQGDYPKALNVLLVSLSIREKLNDRKGVAAVLNNIGGIYDFMEDFGESIKYYSKALDLEKELNNPEGIARTSHNMAVTHQNIGNFEVAEGYYQTALKTNQAAGETYGLALNLQGIGSLQHEQEKWLAAEDYYLQALTLYSKVDDLYGVAFIKSNLTLIYTKTKQYKKAEKYGLQALDEAKQLDLAPLIFEAHSVLAELYRELDSYKLALDHYHKYIEMKEAALNETKIKELAQLTERYEVEKEMEQARKAKEAEKLAVREAIKDRNTKQYLYIFGGFCMFLTIVFVLSLYSNKTGTKFFISFLVLMTFYQFMLVLADPWVEKLTDGIPIPKFIASIGFALFFAFLSQVVRRKLKNRLFEKKVA